MPRRLAGDRLDLHGAGVDLGHLELEQAAQESLVGAADQDLGTLGRPADLEGGSRAFADTVLGLPGGVSVRLVRLDASGRDRKSVA